MLDPSDHATLPLVDELSYLIPVGEIIIPPDRQRNKAEPDETLLNSIRDNGLLQPIIIREDRTLVAGERRLRAHIALEKINIRCSILERLTPLKAFLIELQENIARKQLSWQEETAAVARYHTMRVDDYAGWTHQGTASDVGMSHQWVSKVLIVAEQLHDPAVNESPTFNGAFNYIYNMAERARIAAQSRGLSIAGAAIAMPPLVPINATKEERTAALLAHVNLQTNMAETVDELDNAITNIAQGKIAAAALAEQRRTEVINEIVVNADFLEWAAEYAGPKFDVLHIDFPYGKGYTGPRTRKSRDLANPVYADDPDIYFGLVEGLLRLQDNFTFPAAHCIFWFDMSYYQWTVEMFETWGWKLAQPYPLIWTKGNAGIASDVRRRPRHCYETALLFSRGDRKIVQIAKDHHECALDPEKLHLNQKPVEMLKAFLALVVDHHTAVLDPTCGSGTSLAAAGQLGAARMLGVELDTSNADVARYLLNRYMPAEASHEQIPS